MFSCVVAGTVYMPQEPMFFQSLQNPFVFRCVDGVMIDGNHRGLSKWIYKWVMCDVTTKKYFSLYYYKHISHFHGEFVSINGHVYTLYTCIHVCTCLGSVLTSTACTHVCVFTLTACTHMCVFTLTACTHMCVFLSVIACAVICSVCACVDFAMLWGTPLAFNHWRLVEI